MKPYPSWIGAFVLIGLALMGAAQEQAPPVEATPPAAVTNEDYRELLTNSPFTRALNLSDSLVLTGIAKIGNETMATILNKNTRETYVVSGNANAQGWRLSAVEGDQLNLEKVTAKIAVSGGEVVSVRFEERQLKPGEGKPAGSKDGSRAPSSDTKSLWDRLSDAQRREVHERFGRARQENPNMSREEMSDRFRQELERAVKKAEGR